MMDVTRLVYPVNATQAIPLVDLGDTGVIVWTEVTGYTEEPLPTPHEVPVYGATYADQLAVPGVTAFGTAARIIDALITGKIPAQYNTIAIETVIAFVLAGPAYAVQYDGTEFTVTVAPPVDFVESHNWAGWPVHPYTPPVPPPL